MLASQYSSHHYSAAWTRPGQARARPRQGVQHRVLRPARSPREPQGGEREWEGGSQQGYKQWQHAGASWLYPPMAALAELAQARTDWLSSQPPPAGWGSDPTVVLCLDQVRQPSGQRQQDQRVVVRMLLSRLFRVAAQHPSDALWWAVQHKTSQDLCRVQVVVADTDAARLAAQQAVAAGSITVGDFTIPVQQGPRHDAPGDCVVLIMSQLPIRYARQGSTAALMAAAGQRGEVVAEFLGGSSHMGDADTSCPCADTVVAWVRAPAEDPLLVSLPSSFQVAEGLSATLHVAGRPTWCPQQWQPATAAALAAQARVRCIAESYRQPQSPQGPPQQPQQQQHQQQQGDVGPRRGQQQQRGRQQQQSQQGQPRRIPIVLPEDLDVEMTPAETEDASMGEEEQQWQQDQEPQQQQQQQQRERDGHRAGDQWEGGDGAAAAAAAGGGSSSGASLGLPGVDPALLGGCREDFQRDLFEVTAESDKPAVRARVRDPDPIWAAYTRHFRAALEAAQPPDQVVVRKWLRGYLEMREGSYGGDSDGGGDSSGSDEEVRPRGAAARRRGGGARTPRQPQPQQSGPRRSSRSTRGQVSAAYEALHGPSMDGNAFAVAQAPAAGGEGGGDTVATPGQRRQQQQLPHTPPNTTPLPRGRRGGGGS